MKKQLEFLLQKQICQYLRLQYPYVYFLSDTVANVKLTLPQASRNKSIQCDEFKCPDLLILHPKNGYSGLLIELKKESPYKKNGQIKSSQNDHLSNQESTLLKLNSMGYSAHFAWSFEQAKVIIDDYLK